MRPPLPRLSFRIITLALLLLYGWTLSESTTAVVRVAGGQCIAELYGRTSAITCPNLVGGSLATYAGRSAESAIARGRGPLNRLVPDTDWDELKLVNEDGRLLPATAALPETFELRGRLRRPDDPAGLVFLRPGEDSGWVFIVDGESRRGAWWEWAAMKPARPLQGIPLDKPLIAQTQSFIRLILDGWQGALLLIAAGWGIAWVASKFATRKPINYPAGARRVLGGLLILFVFAMALHVSIDILERVPHVQDSVTYLFLAQTLAGGELTAPAPPLASADATDHFAQEFLLVRNGRWFGKYPPGYPAVLALGVLLHAHWLVNPLLAALTVPLLYVLARALYPVELRRSAPDGRQPAPLNNHHLNTCRTATVYDILPPFLLAVSPFFLVMSGSLMAHTAELFWTTLFMLAWARTLGRGRWPWAIVAGVAIGLLFLTRQLTALTIGLSFGLGWLAVTVISRNPVNRAVNNRQPVATHSPLLDARLPRLLIVALAAAPLLLILFGYQAAVTGDALTDPRLLYWPYDRVGFGPGIGEPENVFTYVASSDGPAIQWSDDPAQPPRGHSQSRGLYNLGRNLSALEDDLFGWPALLTLSFIWMAFLLRRPAAADWVLLLVILAVAGSYVAYWGAGIAYGPRYLYAALPALVLLTARGIRALAAAVGSRPAAIILVALAAYGLFNLPARIESYRAYNYVSAAPRAAVESTVETPALVFITASAVDWWEYGEFFSGNTPRLDGEVLYARDLGQAENNRLRAIFPDRTAYRWRDGRLLYMP